MAISTKGRRKIGALGRSFIWYVAENPDGAGLILHVLSGDKRFIVAYGLGQYRSPSRHIVIKGCEFAGMRASGCWQRVRTPIWEDDDVATPSFVRRLIEWSLGAHELRVFVDWRGDAIA